MPEPSPHVPSTGFARTARRLAGWTSNLIVTAVVLIVGLTLGRQLTWWWSVPSAGEVDAVAPGGAPPGAATLGDDPAGSQFAFGTLPVVLGRKPVTGSRASALAALREACQAAAPQASVARVPGPAEARMLQRIAGRRPVAEQPGRWQTFELDGPIPLVVVIQDRVAWEAASEGAASPEATEEVAAAHAKSGGPQVADAVGRVLCWGFAFPGEAELQGWTLFTCVPTDARSGLAPAGVTSPPAGGRRLLSVQTEAGGTMIAVTGPGGTPDGRRYFDQWFAPGGVDTASAWAPVGESWHRQFGVADRTPVVAVTVAPGNPWLALVVITPVAK